MSNAFKAWINIIVGTLCLASAMLGPNHTTPYSGLLTFIVLVFAALNFMLAGFLASQSAHD
jgi:membrane protein implicated in regulation of membrane protease activity